MVNPLGHWLRITFGNRSRIPLRVLSRFRGILFRIPLRGLSGFRVPLGLVVPAQCRVTKINGTTMQELGLEAIILVIIVNHTGESDIVSSRRCPRVFFQIGLAFTYDREYLLVEMYIFSKPGAFQATRKRRKSRKIME